MGSKADIIIGYLQEKMKGIGGVSMMTMMKETAQELIQNLQEKLKGIDGESVMRMTGTTQAKLKEMGADEMIHNLVEKLKELLLMLENIGLYLMAGLDKVFPPETRKEQIRHWIHVTEPYVLPVLVFLVLFWLCSLCKGVLFWLFRSLFWLCSRCKGVLNWLCRPFFWLFCRGKEAKMMKAPGKNFRMPRSAFEDNPKDYFRSLRAGKKTQDAKKRL